MQTVGVAIATGATIESFMPAFNESEPIQNIWMDVVGHLVLNGVAVVLVQTMISDNDPTGGGLFFPALMLSQPSLRARLLWSSSSITTYLDKLSTTPAINKTPEVVTPVTTLT